MKMAAKHPAEKATPEKMKKRPEMPMASMIDGADLVMQKLKPQNTVR
jgi:hypothetical protein